MPEREPAVLKHVVITAEHGGNSVPVGFENLFAEDTAVLNTHRGYDIASLDLFNYLEDLADFSKKNEMSRLLIEFNRSPHHKQLFSAYSRNLDSLQKQKLYSKYQEYRQEVEHQISLKIKEKQVVYHFSIHTFTPVLNGKTRKADVGLLFDPNRPIEAEICKRIRKEIRSSAKELKVYFNHPYRGVSDGFTEYLRRKFPHNYAGIELEVNQKLSANDRFPQALKDVLKNSILSSLT